MYKVLRSRFTDIITVIYECMLETAHKLLHPWYVLQDGIANLLYWLPIIWRDRDFDYEYLYRILRHKLASMERFFRKYAWGADSEKNADDIKECINLLDFLLYNTYDYDNMSLEEIDKIEKEKKDQLFDLIKDHIDEWWD